MYKRATLVPIFWTKIVIIDKKRRKTSPWAKLATQTKSNLATGNSGPQPAPMLDTSNIVDLVFALRNFASKNHE